MENTEQPDKPDLIKAWSKKRKFNWPHGYAKSGIVNFEDFKYIITPLQKENERWKERLIKHVKASRDRLLSKDAEMKGLITIHQLQSKELEEQLTAKNAELAEAKDLLISTARSLGDSKKELAELREALKVADLKGKLSLLVRLRSKLGREEILHESKWIEIDDYRQIVSDELKSLLKQEPKI